MGTVTEDEEEPQILTRRVYKPLGLRYTFDPSTRPCLGFFGLDRFLSNFFMVEFTMYGQKFINSEQAYVWHKSEDKNFRRLVLRTSDPRAIKHLGSTVKLRSGWDESLRLKFMHDVIHAKFKIPELRRRLISTEQAYLEETNTWDDTFWGRCRGKGKNHLGRQLMVERTYIFDQG